MNILEALELMKQGKKIRRKNWKKGDYMTFSGKKLVLKSKDKSEWTDVVIGLSEVYEDKWEELKEPILDEAEKRYLSAVIRPFRNRVLYIRKRVASSFYGKKTYISIRVGDELVELPYFDMKEMYCGMKVDKTYTLEELGL